MVRIFSVYIYMHREREREKQSRYTKMGGRGGGV